MLAAGRVRPPELDIAELPGRQDGNKVQANVHWRDAAGNYQNSWKYADIPRNTYVTYGMLWDPDKVIFYLNGVEYHRVNVGIHVPMYINFATEIDGDPAEGTYPIVSEID